MFKQSRRTASAQILDALLVIIETIGSTIKPGLLMVGQPCC